MKKVFTLALVLLLAALLITPRESLQTDKLVRLHVIANSDSDYDQAIKLAVKERVYDAALRATQGAKSAREAKSALQQQLFEIEKAANQTLAAFSCGYYADVKLEKWNFPKKNYGVFSLPAGTYDALRVIIGRGEGHNWWCVVFPPLCTAASVEQVQAAAVEAGFTPDEIRYITKEEGGVHYKLKTAQWLRKLLSLLNP